MDNITIVNDQLSEQFICENIRAFPEGFEFPEARNVFIDPPTRGGTIYINSLPGRRLLSWQGLITDDIQESRRQLSLVCQIGSLKTIKFETCDGIALQTQIEIDKLINPYRPNRSPFAIQATAPDFRFLSQELVTAQTGITLIEGGLPIPAAIPAPIPGGSSLSFTVTNNGNVSAQPTLIVRGPGTNFLIQNITTGEKINLNLALVNNEEVTIDTLNRTASKASQNVYGSVVATPAGDWLSLAPGNNVIVFNAQSNKGVNTRLTVQYRHSYLGI